MNEEIRERLNRLKGKYAQQYGTLMDDWTSMVLEEFRELFEQLTGQVKDTTEIIKEAQFKIRRSQRVFQIYGNGTITPAERNKVETYLAIKYGVTLHNSNNYTTSQDVVVWNAAENAAHYNNVAGIGNDFVSAQHQRQSRSQHPNTNNQVIIGLGGIAETNVTNPNDLTDGQFLVWGDNGNTQALTNSASTYTAFNYAGSADNGRRMNRVWKVQNTNSVGQTLIRFPKASVGTTAFATGDDCADYVIIFADNEDFTNATIKSLAEFEDDNEVAFYDVEHTFPAGASYFTYGKVKPWNQGVVYLPGAIEETTDYSDPCDIGDWKYFRNASDNSLKLLGITGFSTTELDNFQVVITPEGAQYDDGTRLTNLMARISTVNDNNAGPLSTGKIRVYYSEDELDATAVAGEQVNGWYKYDGDADEAIADIYTDGLLNPAKSEALTPVSPGTEDGVAYVEFHSIDSFSSIIYISTTESSPLPVTLTDLNVAAEGDIAVLRWSTTLEVDNAGFEVQRSSDARNWTVLGFVEANNAGSTSTLRDYRFNDEKPLNGVNYYRLRQVDISGKSELSHAVSLQFIGVGENLIVYPNPAVSGYVQFDLKSSEATGVKVYNLTGVEMKIPSLKNGKKLNVRGLPAGQYILHVTTATGESYTKIFIVN